MLDALVELLAPVPASSTTIYIADDAHNTRATDIETAHAGDCCVIDADHHLVWAVSPTASSVISLSEIQNNITTNHLRLQFPCPILPHVATVIHQRTVMLFALGTNGHVYRITLAQHQSGMLHSIQQHTRNQWLHVQPLGFSPSHATCMIAAHGCLVIGSADGVLLCAPLDDVAQGDEPLSMVELRDTGNTLGRLFSGDGEPCWWWYAHHVLPHITHHHAHTHTIIQDYSLELPQHRSCPSHPLQCSKGPPGSPRGAPVLWSPCTATQWCVCGTWIVTQ